MTEVLYMCVNDPYLHIEDSSAASDEINTRSYFTAYTDTNPYKNLSSGIENLASLAGINLEEKLNEYYTNSSADALVNIKYVKDINEIKNIIEKELDLNSDEAKFIIKNQTDKIKAQSDAIATQNNIINEDLRVLEQLDHIGDISADLDALFNFGFFKFRFGHIPREAYDSISTYGVSEANDVFFIPSSTEHNEVWGMYFTPKSKSEKVDAMFSVLHFERVRISDKAHGTPEHARSELSKEIEDAKKKILELKTELNSLTVEAFGIIDKYYEKVYMLYSMYELKKKTLHSKSSFHLAAWLPENYVENFSNKLENLSTVVTPVNTPSELPNLTPPTLLKNFLLFKPFEQFTKMYGLPAYSEIDPTPFLALTYILFFGIMFADLGQGLVLSVLGFLIWKLKGINLGRIGVIVGISSAVFGVLFGSVFGMEDIIHGYSPMDHINTFLIAAIVFGVFIISVAMVLNIVNGVRQKNVEKAVFSQNGIAGLIFYLGVLVAGLTMMKYLSLNAVLPIIIGLVILCLLIMYMREPLANIVKKKKKIVPSGPVEFLVAGFFELFEFILSFFTNTISFIRIGAFALNHVGMMTVVMLLSGKDTGSTNPFVIIAGNIIVMALEGLIVGIQCLRLEYYEIFGRFFDGSGREFEPSEPALKKYRNIKY
ncbi:MAG: hypothetical protein FWD71_07040 [Oscillospiraceae bacterium]|nr:hypothetical protein [Oscillospiraceae bacterium]